MLVAHQVDQLEKVAEAAGAVHKAAGMQQGRKVVLVQLDISDRTQVAVLWSKVPQEFHNVDILGALVFFFGSLLSSHIHSIPLIYDIMAVNNAGGVTRMDMSTTSRKRQLVNACTAALVAQYMLLPMYDSLPMIDPRLMTWPMLQALKSVMVGRP